jgi:hypothetical protein
MELSILPSGLKILSPDDILLISSPDNIYPQAKGREIKISKRVANFGVTNVQI